MRSEHRSLLAIALSIAVMVIWYTLFAPEPPEPRTEPPTVAEEALEHKAEPAPTVPAPEPAQPSRESIPEQTVHLHTPRMDATFSNRGGRLVSLVLPGYRAKVDKDSPFINLVSDPSERALELACRHCSFALPKDPVYRVTSADDTSVVFQWDGPNFSLIRRFTISETRYLIDHEVTLINHSPQTFEGEMGLSWAATNPPDQRGFLQKFQGPTDQKGIIFQRAGSVERERASDETREAIEEGVISWAGLESRYFLAAFISRQLSEKEVVSYRIQKAQAQSALYYPKWIVPAGEKGTLTFSIYTGPKEIEALNQIGVGLDEAIDFGWFGIVARPILYCLKLFESVIHSWGVAIILLTVLVKLLLNPLTVKGLKSMKAMQKLQPKLKELREKFGDDKQRLNQETMQMFRTHKVNPMGGCLPMLIQMPLYIALYKVLFNSIELFHVPFLFYKDLSAPDPYYVSPILLGIFMLLQQKMTPTASADPMQQKMMMFMPIMFTGFMLFLPMGLVLYILVNTVMTVVQHYMFNHDIRWRDILRGRLKFS